VYGLPAPSSLLILGIAGTGKSHTAKATAEVLQVATALTDFVPLSKLMAEQIQGLRSWSKG
jgi:SpoVK/Ycf46/Vps4 family AAA+-type ATPase